MKMRVVMTAFVLLALPVAAGTDQDGDGVADADDNCPEVANPLQVDSEPAGSFGAPRYVPIDYFGPRVQELADLDGDGDTDVVIGTFFDGLLVWHENVDGRGTFAPAWVIADTWQDVSDIASADVDGDGDLDIIASTGVGDEIRWYRNVDGTGTFSLGGVPWGVHDVSSIEVADIDGDGAPDIVAALPYAPAVVWIRNSDGQGTFGPAFVVQQSLRNPDLVAVADFDGDGDPDIAVATPTDRRILWYENSFGGVFLNYRLLPGLIQAASLATADLDGDGDPDILVVDKLGDFVRWFENVEGNFASSHVVVSDEQFPREARAVDLDLDGDQDVLAATASGARWYENTDGTGRTWVARTIGVPPLNNSDYSAGAADLNGDQKPDVLSIEWSSSDLYWQAAGADGVGDSCDNCPAWSNVLQVDVDADGVGDRCDPCIDQDDDGLGSSTGPDSACEPDNCPLFPNVAQVDTDLDGVGDVCDNCPELPNDYQPDADGDGVGDVCDNCLSVVNARQRDADLDGVGDSCDACPDDVINDPDMDGVCGLADSCPLDAGWIDNDGDGLGDACDNCPFLPNPDQADGEPVGSLGPIRVFATTFSGWGVLAAGDVDGDGDTDLVSDGEYDAEARSRKGAWRRNVNGRGDLAGPEDLRPEPLDDIVDIVVADFDGDHDDDAVFGTRNDGRLVYAESLGDGRFAPYRTLQRNAGKHVRQIATADLEADGDIDFIVGFEDPTQFAPHANALHVFRNDGAGRFEEPAILGAAFDYLGIPAIADFDGDGDPDVATPFDVRTGAIVWFENESPTPGFTGPWVVDPGSAQWDGLIAFDVDVDGDADLVAVESWPSGRLAWFENADGAGTFAAEQSIPLAISPTFNEPVVLATADLDHDGDSDLIVGLPIDLRIVRLDNLGGGDFGAAAIVAERDDAGIPVEIVVADLNGDDRMDLAWVGRAEYDEDIDELMAWRANGVDGSGRVCDLDDGYVLVLPPADKLTIRWQPDVVYDTFNVYRGDMRALRRLGTYTQAPGTNPVAERFCGRTGGELESTDEPPPGVTAFFLVSGVAAGIEGDLGHDSTGAERPSAHPCPAQVFK